MSIFQLKGDVLTYNFTGATAAPTSDFSTYLGFNTAITGMTVGGTYRFNVSFINNKWDDVTQIIDLLDGVESAFKIPVKGDKPENFISSTRCAVTNFGGTLVFDIKYSSGTDNLTYQYASYDIEVVQLTGNFTGDNAVYFTYNYFGGGGELPTINGGYYQATTGATAGFGDITITGTTFFSGITDLVLYTTDLNQTNLSSLLKYKPQTLNYGFITLQKENSQISHTYLILGSVITTDTVKFNTSAVTISDETFTHLDGIFVSLIFNGTNGSSGTSGSSGSSGTSGSSGSSGTSGSSGSSGTSGSSGSSGTSGSSGSSGTSGSSGSSGSSGTSGTSGVATILNAGDDRVLTSTGNAGEAQAESAMTFDGSLLSITGISEISGSIKVGSFLIQGMKANDVNTGGYYFPGSIIANNWDAVASVTSNSIYFIKDNGTGDMIWDLADASTATTSNGILGMATANADPAEMLLEGPIVHKQDATLTASTSGTLLYLSTNSGDLTKTPPTATNEVVRIVGYLLIPKNAAGYPIIYFKPDQNWIEN